MFLHLGRDGHALAHEDGDDPVGGPGALGHLLDAGERLQRHAVGGAFRQAAAEVVPVTATSKRSRTDRAAEVEREYLRCGVPAELQRHERQQHGLARAGRADDEGVADVADVKGKPERGGAFGLAEQQGGRTEMLVPFRPRPHR